MKRAWLIGLAIWLAATGAYGEELRTNPDGSYFTVSVDPRARPRMSVDDVITLADEGQRTPESSPRDRTTVRRIDLMLAEEVQLVLQAAPFQETQRGRWVWVVQVLGRFVGGSGPGGSPDYEGREGWYLIDDGSGAVYAWGFTKEKAVESPTAATASPSAAAAAAACQRHDAIASPWDRLATTARGTDAVGRDRLQRPQPSARRRAVSVTTQRIVFSSSRRRPGFA